MNAVEIIAKVICCGGLPCGGCLPDQYQRATRKAQAVISALSDAGMVVVPRKPTEAMTAGPRGLELTRISRSTEIAIYRSMIAAHEAQPIAEGR